MMHVVAVAALTDNTYNKLLLLFINTIGNTGVTIFILISGYFSIRFSIQKLVQLWSIVWFYSVISFIYQIAFTDYCVNYSDILTAIFPILRYKYWFMTCYIILFCISPYLNKLIHSLSQKSFLCLLSILCFFFYVSPTFMFTEILNDHGKGIINMTIVYLIGQYLRHYDMPRLFNKYKITILMANLSIIFLLNTFITYYKGYFFLKFSYDNSLFILISSICILLIFKQLKESLPPPINYIAGFTFPLYLFQELLSRELQSWSAPYINDSKFIIMLIATTCCIWCITIIIELFRRKTLNNINKKVAMKIESYYRHTIF